MAGIRLKGLDIKSIQRDVKLAFAMVSGVEYDNDVVVACESDRSILLPKSLKSCTDGASFYIYGASVYIKSDTAIRCIGLSNPAPASFSIYADIITLRARPKSIQYVTNTAAAVALATAVNLDKAIVIPQMVAGTYGGALQNWAFNSSTELAWAQTTYQHDVVCIVDP